MADVPPASATQDGAPAVADVSPDAALLQAYARATDIPSPLQKWYDAFQADRDYVNDLCMTKDAQDAVGTNHILRNQYILNAQLNSRDADIAIEPCDAIWPPTPQLDPILGPTGAMLPGEPPPELELFSRTLEVLARRLLAESRFRQQLRGAIQDVETNALVFVKVTQQQDLKRDPIGALRQNDQQDNFALYAYWKAKEAAGEIIAGSSEAQRLVDLEKTIRLYLAASLREAAQKEPLAAPPGAVPLPAIPGMPPEPPPEDPRIARAAALEGGTEPIDPAMIPEVASWIGFNIDIVMPEDIRYTWSVTRPEDWYRGDLWQHRVFYTTDAFAAKFGLTPEEMKKVPLANVSSTPGTGKSNDTTNRDQQLSEKALTGQVEVWEAWDRSTNTVVTYVKGYDKKLQSYTPTAVWRNWVPIIPFLFNRVTGRLVGISSTTLQRPLQDEINLYRSHERHAKKACFPRILVKKGAMTPNEAKKYKKALPYEVIEVDDPDELQRAIMETKPVAYNPALYDNTKAEMDLQRMAGVSLVTGGAVGASNSATEVAEASQGVDMLADFKRGLIEDLYVDVITCLLDMAVTVLPEENVKALCGPGALWPPVDRETFWRHTQVKVKADSTGKPDAKKHLEMMAQLTQISRNLGLVAKGPEIMDELARDSGYYGRLSKFFQLPAMPMPGGPNMGGPGGPSGPPGASGGPPPSTPGPDSKQGEGGGRPPGGAPAPESIPNRPQV